MKALVKKESQAGLLLEDVPMPKMGLNDVLIRIQKTGICGTDLHIYNWNEWAQKTIPIPMQIGHEFVGVVEALGSSVEGFQIGDSVCGEGHIVCDHCRNCLAGRRHLCAYTLGVGVNRPGAFAEFLSIPKRNVWHADPDIPDKILALFDPLGNATHSALSFDMLGEDVFITGAGPIGIMAVAISKHAGARHIVISDLNDYRLRLAKKMGATVCLNPSKESIEPLKEKLGMREGFDVGLEMSGNSDALSFLINHMAHGGNIALLGIPDSKTTIDWEKVVFNGLTLKGIYGRKMYETWYKMTAMIQNGLDISSVITHYFKYSDYRAAFEVMQSGNSGKVILEWN